MKIKRFVAPDMRTALRMIRDEHGPDAVILSNRRTEEGIEIVAANNYDEALVQRALDSIRPEAPTPPAPPKLAFSAANPAPRPTLDAAPNSAMAMMAAISERRSAAQTASQAQAAPRPAPSAAPAVPAAAPVSAALAKGPARQLPDAPQHKPFAELLIPREVFANAPVQAQPAAPAWSQEAPPQAEHMQAIASMPAAQPAPEPALAPVSQPAPAAAALQSAAPPLAEHMQAVAPMSAAQPAPQLALAPVSQPAPAAAPLQSAAPPLAEHMQAIASMPAAQPAPEPALAPVSQLAPAAAAPLAAVPSLPAPQTDAPMVQLRDELALMRQMIEREMHRLTDERLRGSPVRTQALQLMEDYGFDAGLTRDVVMQIPADAELHRGRGLMLSLLSQRVPIAPVDPIQEGGVIALIGPTGAGKTTTIAKLASRFLQHHAARDVALVTTDTIRVGGREQLHSYGRQFGIAVHEADSDAALQQLLQRLSDYKLVLIDTAGMGQRDRALAAQLNWLRGSRAVRSLLVLPANAHFSDLDEVVRRFAGAAPQGVILTKLDETGRFGSALSVVVDHQLPITWVTDGQQVPDDLHRANAASLVLRLEDLRRDADKPCTPEQNHAVA